MKNIDPMEMASRMQAVMMENPEEGMKLMQQNQALGETFADTMVGNAESRLAQEQELEGLKARYDAALEKALAPIKAKFEDLDKRAQKDLVAVGESWVYAPWAVAEWNALTAQSNKEYERVCGEWWAASGPFHSWLDQFRERLIQNEIPKQVEADSVGAGFMRLLANPNAPYESTATLRAVHDYMDHTSKVFAYRRRAPDKAR